MRAILHGQRFSRMTLDEKAFSVRVNVRDRRALRRACARLANETGEWVGAWSPKPRQIHGGHHMPLRGNVHRKPYNVTWWALPARA